MFMTTYAFFVYTRVTICTKQFSISSHGVKIQKYTWFGKPPLIRKRQCYTHGIWQKKERYTTQNCARCEIKQNLRWENNLIENFTTCMYSAMPSLRGQFSPKSSQKTTQRARYGASSVGSNSHLYSLSRQSCVKYVILDRVKAALDFI